MKNDVEAVVMTKPINKRVNHQSSTTQYSEHSTINMQELVQELVYCAPDFNQALIQRLKKLIASGDYQSSADVIAEKMLASLHT